jgi:hypothetical protein
VVKRLICAIVGHRWSLTPVCHLAWTLRQISSMAGREGFCLRCSAMWYDSCSDCQRARVGGAS